MNIYLDSPCEYTNRRFWSGRWRKILGAPSVGECCRLCKEDPECKSFVYWTGTTRCSLKRDSSGSMHSRDGHISSALIDISDCACGKIICLAYIGKRYQYYVLIKSVVYACFYSRFLYTESLSKWWLVHKHTPCQQWLSLQLSRWLVRKTMSKQRLVT